MSIISFKKKVPNSQIGCQVPKLKLDNFSRFDRVTIKKASGGFPACLYLFGDT